jgi:hypothetical protein
MMRIHKLDTQAACVLDLRLCAACLRYLLFSTFLACTHSSLLQAHTHKRCISHTLPIQTPNTANITSHCMHANHCVCRVTQGDLQGEGEPCVGGVRGLTPWGVSARVPQAVDWSLNARMWGLLQGESEGCVLHDALRLLSRGMCQFMFIFAAAAWMCGA